MATRRRYFDIPEHARRDFIKWSVGMGVALGLKPWKVFEATESVLGPAFADSAATAQALRTIHVIAGNGGLAWFTQVFPFAAIAADTTGNLSFYKPGMVTPQAVNTAQGDQPMNYGPDTPKALTTYGIKASAYLCGKSETHTNQPVTAITVAANTSMLASVAAIQVAQPTLVPAISVGTLPYGTAPGAPALASVPNATAIAGLFKSAAASAGGALALPANAALFEAYFKANIALQKAAGRPTQTQSLLTAKSAANLLGKQLNLAPTAADLTRYGIDSASLTATAGNAAGLTAIGTTLIQAFKAFQLNLTSSVILPAMNNDPHGFFGSLASSTATVQQMGVMFNAFITDMMTTTDPLSSTQKMGQNMLITITGDTFKTPVAPSGWGDGTPSNANRVVVIDGSGSLAGGEFGTCDIKGNTTSFDASTGAQIATGTTTLHQANSAPVDAAVLYAVSLKNARRVEDFYRGAPYTGLTDPTKNPTG
jgi:hypothetical protein